MTMKDDFRISVGDDSQHENLTAEIYYKESFLGLLSQEDGFEHLQLEIYPSPNVEAWSFNLKEFLAVIEGAKKRLWELRKI